MTIKGTARIIVSEATVIEAMQEWAIRTFQDKQCPTVTGIRAIRPTASKDSVALGTSLTEYELDLAEKPA